MTSHSLAGRRVLVTRAAHQAGKLSDGLRALGAEPVEVPVLAIEPPPSYDPLDRSLGQLGTYQWLILTSANTVRICAERAAQAGVDLTGHSALKVAAVGKATAKAATEAGFTVSFVPESYLGESLAEGLLNGIAGKRVLLARAAVARDIIPDTLRAAGAIVDVVDAYLNMMPADAPDKLKSALSVGIDAAAFTSSSTVTHLSYAAARAGIPFPLENVRAVSIGPITSQTLRELGWSPAAEADPSDISGLIAAVALVLGGSVNPHLLAKPEKR